MLDTATLSRCQAVLTRGLAQLSVAAKKGAILALETGPLVRLRSGLR